MRVLQPVPRSPRESRPRLPAVLARLRPGPGARGGRSIRSPGLLGPHAGPTAQDPGSGRRRLPAGAHGNAPPRAARPGPALTAGCPRVKPAARRPRCPRAASPPRRPAPARTRPPVTCGRVPLLLHLAALSREPPLSPPPRLGAAHPAGYSAKAWGEGRGGNYHILAYQRARHVASPANWHCGEAGIGLNTPRCCSGLNRWPWHLGGRGEGGGIKHLPYLSWCEGIPFPTPWKARGLNLRLLWLLSEAFRFSRHLSCVYHGSNTFLQNMIPWITL